MTEINFINKNYYITYNKSKDLQLTKHDLPELYYGFRLATSKDYDTLYNKYTNLDKFTHTYINGYSLKIENGNLWVCNGCQKNLISPTFYSNNDTTEDSIDYCYACYNNLSTTEQKLILVRNKIFKEFDDYTQDFGSIFGWVPILINQEEDEIILQNQQVGHVHYHKYAIINNNHFQQFVGIN